MGKTVVFDLDGTLADTSDDLIAAANACFVAAGYGAVLDAEADALTAFRGGRAMLTLGFQRLGVETPEIDRWYPYLLEAYAQDIDARTELYPGAVAAVEALRSRDVRVGICTNKPEGLAEELMRRLGVREMFGALVGADTLPVRKPDPAPYRETVRRVGGDIGASLLIGDTITDVKTARAAGVPIVLVGFGPSGEAVREMGPDAVLAGFDGLEALVVDMLGA